MDFRTTTNFRGWVFDAAGTSGAGRACHLPKSCLRRAPRPSCYLRGGRVRPQRAPTRQSVARGLDRTAGHANPLIRRMSERLTHRAALGGPLTARELFFRRIGLPPWLVFILLYFTAARVSGPIYSGAYCPWVSMAREAWSLSLVTCHAGFSRRGIDPVGETANVNEPPLGSRRLVVSSLACASW